jgi:hypothetical protein
VSGGPSWARHSPAAQSALSRPRSARQGGARHTATPGKEQQRHSDAASRCHRARAARQRGDRNTPQQRAGHWLRSSGLFPKAARTQAASPHPPATVPPLVRARRPVFCSPRPARPRPAGRSLSLPAHFRETSAPPRRPAFNPPTPPRRETSICPQRRGGRGGSGAGRAVRSFSPGPAPLRARRRVRLALERPGTGGRGEMGYCAGYY